MSVSEAIQNAADHAAADSANQAERNRQEAWQAKRDDEKSLRDGLNDWAESEFARPKIKVDDGEVPETPREAAERAWEASEFNAAQRERDAEESEQIREIGERLERKYGLNRVDGFKKLLSAVERLETDGPQAVAALYQTYVASPDHIREVQQREHQATVDVVEEYFRTRELNKGDEARIMDALAKGKVERTGNPVKDLDNAVRFIRRGSDRAVLR